VAAALAFLWLSLPRDIQPADWSSAYLVLLFPVMFVGL
jgi:hypothetical protein